MKTQTQLRIVLASILVAFAHAAGAGETRGADGNLVENPGFEALDERGDTAIGWRQVSARPEIAPRFALDAQVARSGKYTAKLSSRGSAGTFGYWTTTVTGIQGSGDAAADISPVAAIAKMRCGASSDGDPTASALTELIPRIAATDHHLCGQAENAAAMSEERDERTSYPQKPSPRHECSQRKRFRNLIISSRPSAVSTWPTSYRSSFHRSGWPASA